MTFEARKDKSFSYIFYTLFFILVFALVLVYQYQSGNLFWIIETILGIVLFVLLWYWYIIEYQISNNLLSLNAGPFKVNIPIRTIKKIETGKTMWLGLKLGHALKGTTIYYNDYDQVYISPEEVEKFVKVLKKANPNIEVIRH